MNTFLSWPPPFSVSYRPATEYYDSMMWSTQYSTFYSATGCNDTFRDYESCAGQFIFTQTILIFSSILQQTVSLFKVGVIHQLHDRFVVHTLLLWSSKCWCWWLIFWFCFSFSTACGISLLKQFVVFTVIVRPESTYLLHDKVYL